MESQKQKNFLAASVGERSCGGPASRLRRKLQKSRRQAVEIQAKMNSRKAEEIDVRMQIVQLWTEIKKAIVNNRVPCQPVCKIMIPEERDINWFQDSRTKDSELTLQNEKGPQQTIEHQRNQQKQESTFEFCQERKNSTNYRRPG